MTMYIKEVLVRLASVPAAGSSVTLEVPEGTEIGATITVIFSDGLGANPTVNTYSRVGQYITVLAPTGVGETSVVMRIEQSSDFQDDSVGIQEVTIVATNTINAGSNASVSADNSEKGKAKLTFNIPKGEAGKSAYELAVAAGFVGTEVEYLLSLKGANGTNGVDGAVGKSNYELAVQSGFSGTQMDFLDSLKGVKGDNGKSLNPRGYYSSSEVYNKYDLVSYSDKVYMCVVDNTTDVEPLDNSPSWFLLVKDGIDGKEGRQGNRGEQGEKGTDGVNGVDGVSIGGSRFDELAGGVFWWIRPRYNVVPNDIPITNVTPSYYLDSHKLSTEFVVENTLYEDHGVHIPTKGDLAPSKSTGQTIRVVPTSVSPFGTASVGKLTDRWEPMNQTIFTHGFKGAYYVELDPALVTSESINAYNLHQLEVDVQGVQASGYDVRYESTTTIEISTGRSKGVVLPVYLGAMKDPVTGKVYLLFRPVTYAKRRNTATVEDVMEWDGISNNGGESGGWDLRDSDVKWWSTNVAQGFRFVAKMRRR
jgi:hypothetical protein